jgi:hypothetical protein
MFTFNPDLARDDEMEDGDEAFDTANLPTEEEEADVVTKLSHCFFESCKILIFWFPSTVP